jgi:ATP-binding cassette subfamily B protein
MNSAARTFDLASLAWPGARLGEAIEWLARRRGLPRRTAEILTSPPIAWNSESQTAAWIGAQASAFAMEAEHVECPYPETEAMLKNCGPALLRVRARTEICFLAVLRGSAAHVTVVTPALTLHRVDLETLRSAICQEMEAPVLAETQRLLEQLGVPRARRAKAGKTIRQLAGARVSDCWLLRLAPGAGLWLQAREARIPGRIFALLAAHAAQYVLWLLSWWMLGEAALQGRFDWGWLTAWALVLFATVPFRLLVTWWQGILAIRIGGLLKRRLLFGALQLHPDEIRNQGAGQLLGCVIESEVVETLALSGGFLALLSGLELAFAAGVMAFGPAATLQLLLLAAWVIATAGTACRYFRARDWWTQSRLNLTNDLVERMVGHRTRLAQENPQHWHDGEDQAVNGLLALASGMDRSAMWLASLVPRGWLLLGLLALVPSFVRGNFGAAQLAVGLGGVLLAFRALQRFVTGLSNLVGAVIAGKQIVPLMRAARPQLDGVAPFSTIPQTPPGGFELPRPLLEAHALNFCYRHRGLPVLRECNVKIRCGDRILLEGPSGGGKSTFASVLTGLQVADSGLLLLHGLDRQSVGLTGWRRHVAAAPQFHENHVLTSSFAFNLLMGGRWPPRPEALEEAETVCRELGLENLLKRMPAGLLQMVGEGGWQLSHGEKSRLYIARALLQGAELVVLDESFASLDPENLRRALRCVLDRAKTLLVIAHP